MSDQPTTERPAPTGPLTRYFRISDEGEILMHDLWVPRVVQRVPDDAAARQGAERLRMQHAG